MKKKLVLPLAALLALGAIQFPSLLVSVDRPSTVNAAYASGEEANVSVIVDGQPLALDAAPQLVNGTLMAPLRNIAEALGADVTQDESTGSYTIVKGESTVTLFLNDTNAFKNGSAFVLAAPPVMRGSVMMAPLRFLGEAFGSVVKWDGINGEVSIDREENLLPVVGSFDKLKELMEDAQQTQENMVYDRLTVDRLTVKAAPASAGKSTASGAAESSTAASADKKANAGSADYSATNVQVQGVDEADIVKTDGEYIYQVNKGRIVIARAYPAGEMRVVSTVSLEDRKLLPSEIYVDGDLLVVIGQASPPIYKDQDEEQAGVSKVILPPIRQNNLKAIVYNIGSKTDIKAVKEVELGGRYVTSRKIGSEVYIIANRYVDGYSILSDTSEQPAPSYRDSAAGDDFMTIPYEQIRYFPDSLYSSYLLIAGFDTKKPEQKANVSAYLGSGENVYASASNLYVTVTRRQTEVRPLLKQQEQDDGSLPVVPPSSESSSVVYKFLMDQGKVRFAASGEVPGTVLNQFSMDEANGYFRIATTKGDVWRTDEQTSKNNLYVLDEAMNITGKIENIAPGEKIYSVRFMGNRGYMVTFRKVDPLFVLDLSDPQKPGILGKLKIPGYSDYLHPYDETHLIGFGKDAVEVANEEGQKSSGGSDTTAYYQGLKIALFDVSDVSNPKELFKETIGDRGTDSPLLDNHKALLFSREKNLLAFPVSVAEIRDDTPNKDEAWAYGSFAFQGVYVYNLDLAGGFRLKGKITHLTDEDIKMAGNSWYRSGRNIDRALYIGSTLYTLSQSEIRANDLSTLQEVNRLTIPE